jgi:hypothetical protein
MTHFEPEFTIFHPIGRPEQVWILTPRWVTVHNLLDGSTATISYVAFNTELVKRGIES